MPEKKTKVRKKSSKGAAGSVLATVNEVCELHLPMWAVGNGIHCVLWDVTYDEAAEKVASLNGTYSVMTSSAASTLERVSSASA